MNTKGLTIIEAMIALIILAIALSTIVPSLTSYTKINNSSENQGEAVAVAQHVMDGLRKLEFTSWPTNGNTMSITSGSKTYDAKVSWCLEGVTGCYTTGSARQVKVEVIKNAKTIYQIETVYTDFE